MARGGRGTFGLTSRGRRGSYNNFRGGFRRRGSARGRGGRGGGPSKADDKEVERGDDGTQAEERFERAKLEDEVDEKMGFQKFTEGPKREAWLVNMHPTLVKDEDWPGGRSGVDFYFIQDDGGMFKCTILHEPYFYIGCKTGSETIVEEWLLKKYEGMICRIMREKKEDLKLPNHLLGHKRLYLQLHFRNVWDLLTVRKDLMPLALSNGAKLNAVDAYAEVISAASASAHTQVQFDGTDPWSAEAESSKADRRNKAVDPTELITDIREYDVPYYLRVAIDNEIRVGLWYNVTASQGVITLSRIHDRVKRAEPVVMAYDIETCKAPLKFPDPAVDQIMMISYMIDGQGFLITNREIVSEDIDDFEYTPKPEYEGPFIVFNEPDEPALIRRWFEHIRESKPTVMATFNGDAFDFPYVEARAKIHGIDMFMEVGFSKDSEDEFKSRSCIHMDCFRWVKRDSYLPQGSQGLKAVTTSKLGYNPIELDPELMTPYAVDHPQLLAQYSVSDAVATYYLYMKYVNPFIFSLCNIIPLNPDEVLRKGSGTLCETLLMVEAYRGNIIMPNRHDEPHGAMFEGHLLASETYVGGHVEALEAGVFRSDIPTHFKITPDAVQGLINDLDAALEFCIVEESKMVLDNVTNYAEVKAQILSALEELRDNPMRTDKPLIYHLDVAAMYPNIMLSNRLQPDSVVDEAMCAVCDYNRPGKTCDRRMTWAWRGEYFPAQRDEFNMVKHALNQEWFPPKRPNGPKRRFPELTETEQTALLHKRLGDYSRKVYKKTKDTRVVEREAIICQRENPFYVDTVRSFRDRRYEYKGLLKTWKKNFDNANAGGSVTEIEEAKKMIVVYDSLQLAHKCILNSFYGYVMRKGARWHSMEMAGITCLTGAKIIQMARQLVEQIGRPLELDTDGIWCMLPGTFPENFTFKVATGKPLAFSYPCTMLNHLVHAQFTNHQYHDLSDPATGQYAVHSENSIFFELDGPYKAMILPSSKEEDKLLKKRYAVFNDDGSLAELKGFEVKRRGELQLIKIFQSQIFEKFLLGSTTEECYTAVAKVADQWLDVLFSKGESLGDDELIELIAENRSMSKTLAEYGGQKSTSISTAKRLADFLGEQMVKDKGLSCKFIISARPIGAPVTERAIPVAIFSAEETVKRAYLRKWIKDNSITNFDLRSILDWNYYIERLGSVIQKLITIPAAMQKVSNPVPRIRHPDWLHKRVSALEDKFQQHKMTDFFKKAGPRAPVAEVADMEDFGDDDSATPRPRIAVVNRKGSASTSAGKQPAKVRLPDPAANYSAWLKAIRPIWKSRREERMGGTTAKQVPAMFRGVKTNQSRTWEIIQIRPTQTPGKFVLWLAAGMDLVPIPLRIPRQFYLNLKAPPDKDTFGSDYVAESIVRTLPRNHPCLNLFRVTVAEEIYLEAESHFANLTNNPTVDGVYEMQIPHLMRALLKLGTSCGAEDGSSFTLNQARDTGVGLRQLTRASASLSRRKYLDGGKAYKYVLLFHCATAPRHVFALFHPNGTLKLHLVDPATRRQPLAKVQETYASLLRDIPNKGNDTPLLSYPSTLPFDITYHGNEATALKAISRELGFVENQSYILVLSSAKTLDHFETSMPKLAKFPVIMWEGSRRLHSLDVFPWQPDAVKKMFLRYLSMDRWLRGVVEDATYFDIPIGNIGGDRPLLYADVTFARRLLKLDQVIWWSPGSRPDLGGREDDGNVSVAGEDLANPELSVPGCYSNVCLSIGVKQLAINAVLQSALVNEMEGSGGATSFDSASHTLDEYASGEAQSSVTLGDAVLSAQTFSVLKAMVKTWELDYQIAKGQGSARITVDHFWRWLSSNASQMFDPSLQRFVHGLMRKIFFQMLAEFKRLGSNIVSADFGHIILLTSKPPGTAYAYATYLLTAINSNDLFKHIILNTDQFYDFLVFMDKANQGGVVCEDPLSVEVTTKITVNMAWNIQAFLPPALQPRFQDVIQRFIVDIHRIHNKNSNPSRTPLRVVQNLSQDSEPAQDAEKIKEVEAIRTYISQRMTRRLLESISAVIEDHRDAMMQEEVTTDFQFPLLPGSYLNMTNPSLEFVKFICAVFSLASAYTTEVGVLRRNLLDLVGVREFSEEAKFRNPCEPFKLPMVICNSCNDVRDFDFCRDLDLLPNDAKGFAIPRWQCGRCHADYDRQAIEASLIEVTRRMITSFQLQDLRCTRCKEIKADNLTQNCNCSGDYNLTVHKQETRRKLRTIVNVAVFHKLSLLQEYAEFMLNKW